MANLPKLVSLSLCASLAGGCCGFATDDRKASAVMREIVEEPIPEMVEEPVPTSKKKKAVREAPRKATRKATRTLKQKSVATCRKGSITLYRLADGTIRSPDWAGLSVAQRRACILEAFSSP